MAEKSKSKPILIILILLLLVAGFFAVMSGIKSNKLNEEKSDLTFELAEVMKDLEAARVSLDTLRGQNDELDELITKRQKTLDSMTTVVENLLKSNNINKVELTKAQRMIQQLQNENLAFTNKIDSLYKENVYLANLSDSLHFRLTEEIVVTSKLMTQKDSLSKKVELGSLLQANNIYVTGIKTKSSGKEVETLKTKRMDQIKVCFETGENRVREEGKVTLYLRLLNPEGITLAIQSLGSGIFSDKSNGQDKLYTKVLPFDYDNTNKQVCAYWAHNVFSEGMYTAEIYQNGHLLGSKEFELR